jgi:hypothetical protein
MANLSRRQKESRAYSLVLVSGGAGVATVVLLVLAIVGIGGFGLPFLTAIVTAIAYFLFRRTVGP